MDTINDSLRGQIEALDRAIGREPDNGSLYVERGKCYHKAGIFDRALNDFLRARELSGPDIDLLREIFAFRYTDLYNP